MRKKLTLWFRRMMWRHFDLVHQSAINPALEEIAETYDFVCRSGHLSNGYVAGKKVKRGMMRAVDAFLDARSNGGVV